MDKFVPERWLVDNERYNQMDRYFLTVFNYFSVVSNMQFGMGSRTCIDKNISLMEIAKIIPQIIRNFDIELFHSKEWKTRNHWFVKQTEFFISVTRRK